MPRGPKGEKRKADVVGNAVLVAKIATGEVEDKKRNPGTQANREGGLKGGKARAKALSSSERKAIAKKAAAKRWSSP